uniref:ciliogenesis and planar polarity effector 1 isoform X2 n=1 Tax=Doryrhamphus excisus TaxID=161450 RepID=UPI0025ADD9ED|nr:ciliogenesis and planar polarity effector 1 isoform X2 [Doryrhamphus excisus]
MELKLEVVLCSSIKRKKPWPRFCWLGQEKESVFLLDDKRISEINMVNGRTKKKTPKLHPLLNNVVTMAPSDNGLWFSGLLRTGEMFLWNRDKDLLKTTVAVPEVAQLIAATQGNAPRLSVQVSGDGMRVLVVSTLGHFFLWECLDVGDLKAVPGDTIKGRWAQIQPLHDTVLPTINDKETYQCAIFLKTQSMGDVCLSAFVFTCGKKLIITYLKIQWMDDHMNLGSMGYSIQWATKTYSMSHFNPTCHPVKSRGALVADFSPDGQLLAIILNQRQPKATQVLFVSTQNFVSVSSGLGGCGCKAEEIPSKYIRSYWVGSLSWSHDGLFLACVLKRGALLILARLGGLLSLTSSGCNVDFGPAHFIPLHPLVTYRPQAEAGRAEAYLSSSSVSARDIMRQRYSVTWHPRLLYCIVSDGYMATVLRVLNRPSPAMLVKAVLDKASKDLWKAGQLLDTSQSYVKVLLDYVASYHNLDHGFEESKSLTTSVPHAAESVPSAATLESSVPLFLQDQGHFSGTKELLEKVQTFFDDDSEVDGPPPGSQPAEGRLEFASMFDTLHALDSETDSKLAPSPVPEEDSEETTRCLHHELVKIQNGLLTAWALCMSLGNAVENRAHLLKYAVYRVAQLCAFLHLIPSADVHSGTSSSLGSSWLLQLLKTLLSFLPWDHSSEPHVLGLVVELSKQLAHLLLGPQTEACPTGRLDGLRGAVSILNLVSDALDRAYSLQPRSVWSSAEKDPQIASSDVYHVPVLQDHREDNCGVVHQCPSVPQRPSSRLVGVWHWVYSITRQYQEEVRDGNSFGEDEEQLSVIMSEIQTALQAAGERLEEGPSLLNYTGEQQFLCGLYENSAETWRSQIWEQSEKGSRRSVFLETRLCLALLYSMLAQYHLREAMELGEHMAHLVLHNAGHYSSDATCTYEPLLPTNLHHDAACSVIHALARFMASYFTNQPLKILPPHNVAVLPPLHLPHASNVARLVPLSQEEVARAVRQQHLSEKWTVDYALDLLLLGGLLPETAWLAYNLGDWKTAASVSLAYNNFCTDHLDFTRINRQELHLPKALLPQSIFQAELQWLLDNNTLEPRDITDKSCIDPLEEEDLAVLQVSIQEILKASVMADVNVLSSPLTSLLDSAKDLCSGLPALVHSGLYLPSPPLYCPQPSPNTQDPVGTVGQLAEVTTRHKVSGVLQRMLLLLRAAHCCHPAAQWYISHLRRARHLLFKIKKRYCYPSALDEEKVLPEGLRKFVSHGGFFKRVPNNKNLDVDAIQTIICFRELCGLCWMLHVRDHLSIACRKYQAARMQQADSEILSACVDAVLWAQRYLPFSHFLNAEEILQDLMLSLVSELPPLALVADTLVLAFPEKEESVRVPLREKYKSLLQRLEQCSVTEGNKQQASGSMTVVIQDKLKQRRKHLGRMLRHLAPLELRLWGKEDEEDDGGCRPGMSVPRQLSPAMSVSTSTLTDGNTEEVEVVASTPHSQSKARVAKDNKKKTSVPARSGTREQNVSHCDAALPSLPVVGTWEFELEDDEYLNFLELFLSYMLEKDSAEGGESPLLKSFGSTVRERELHSLTFDVLTTMHRRQRESGQHLARKHRDNDLPVFRAGGCHRTVKRGTTPESQTSTSLSALAVSGRQSGLFNRHQSSTPLQKASASESNQSALQPTECCSISVEAIVEVQQVLDPKLEAQFPELGRLLEWMLRWADRRVLQGHPGKKKQQNKEGTSDKGIVMRVKASAPAVLTSLSLLERRFTPQHEPNYFIGRVQVPEPQWTVAPMVRPEEGMRLERESSVDTGYPGSANTPIGALDHNLQQREPSIGSHADEPAVMMFQRTPLPDDPDDVNVSAPRSVPIQQRPCFDDLDVTPEKEGKSDNDCTELSSSFSNTIISENPCSPQMSLKVADLMETSSSASLSSQAGSHPSTQTSSDPNPPNTKAIQPEEEQHTSRPVDHPSRSQPHPSIPCAPTVDPIGPNHPPNIQPSPLRQRVGEDLYRLVQHINYMSLMEVLGASFFNLQLAQQNSSLHPVAPSSHVANVTPQQNLTTPQSQQIYVPNPESNNPASMYAQQLPIQSLHNEPSPANVQYHNTRNLPSSTHGNYQGLQARSVQAESTEVQIRNKNFTPPAQGLLITNGTSHAAPSSGNVNIGQSSQASGVKLLQLQQTFQQEPNVPHAPSHATVEPSIRAASGTRDKKRRIWSSTTKKLIRFSHREPPESTPRKQRSEGSEQTAQNFASTHGLRLLHLQAGPQGHITFPRIPSPPPLSRPLIIPAVPLGETPKLQLLHINPRPRIMSTQAPRLSQKIRLISLEELTGLVAGRRNSEEARLQLLRVNDPTETSRGATPTSDSSKRQKRRERVLRASETNESAIITQVPKKEPLVAEVKTPARVPAIKPGSINSMPTGRTLLDRATSTSAELHAFASTCKRPPECLDAFTNTEPKCPPMLVDKAVSTQASVAAITSEETGQLREESPPRETHDILPSQEKINLDQVSRNFLSVLDIEERAQHQDLPPLSSGRLERKDAPASSPPVLTPAQLHLLAASIVSGTHPAAQDPHQSVRISQQTTKPITQSGLLEDSASVSFTEPQRLTPPHVDDSPDSDLYKAINTPQIDRPHSPPLKNPTAWFSSRLSELDSQLAALQNIADCLENDLPGSKIANELVNKPEHASAVSAPKPVMAARKTVRLFLPAEEHKTDLELSQNSQRKNAFAGKSTQPPQALPQPAIWKMDNKEDQEEENHHMLHHNSSTPDGKTPSLHPSFSSQLGHGSSPSSHHSAPPKLKNLSPGTLETFDETANGSLDQMGLSDTMEILEGLVREGYLSQTDLEMSFLGPSALDLSRQENQSSDLSLKRALADDERRELRMWMRRKQRERGSVYQKQRASLRERERKPFSASRTLKSPNHGTISRNKEETQKAMLLKQFNQRIREATSLADQLGSNIFTPSRTFVIDESPMPAPAVTTVRCASAPPGTSNRRAKSLSGFSHEKKSLKHPSGQTHAQHRPWTAEIPGQPSEDSKRLPRPGTSLSREHPISPQGLLSSTESHEEQHFRNMKQQRKVADMEESDAANPRGPSSDVFKLLGLDKTKTELLAGLSDQQDDGAIGGASGMEWLNKVTESGGSSLSDIDWAAIEKMAAAHN